MTDTLPPLLLGLFRELKANAVPVGVRDYLDGLRALRLGFGHSGREQLRDMALILWSRSDEERRLIARWFDALPTPDSAIEGKIDAFFSPGDSDSNTATIRLSSDSSTPFVPSDTVRNKVSDNRLSDPANAPAPEASARVAFAGIREGSGIPVPRLTIVPSISEDYVLHPQSLISSRDMAVLWRRYRRSTRYGRCTELDLHATLRERCSHGLLCRPVLRPRRSNSARLLLLVDASPSMDPWRPFFATLSESLTLSRLGSADLYYFNNLPRTQLFTTVGLGEPEELDEILCRHAGAGLLVVSDGGSARGVLNRRRAIQTAAFLARVSRQFPAAAWLNPMPPDRWTGTTAAHIAAGPVPMLPLDAAHLLRAIDILRGNK